MFNSTDKVATFKAKLKLWRRQVNIGVFVKFQTLAEILKETEPGPSFSQLVHDHLSQNDQKSLSTTSQPEKTSELGRNGSATHL